MFENRTMEAQEHIVALTSSVSKAAEIAADLRTWWGTECTDWDAAVTGADPATLPGGTDLWDDMPQVDSKAIARTSPIFERHLGVPLDVRLIRPGGYTSIDDAIADLVPKMQAAANAVHRNGP
jgi:hypothetical protein